jgi:uncharacterized protein YukE
MGTMQGDIDEAAGELTTILSRLDFLMTELAPGWQTAGSATFFQGMNTLGLDLNAMIKEFLNIGQNVGLSRTAYDAQTLQEQDLAQKFTNLIGGSAPVVSGNF